MKTLHKPELRRGQRCLKIGSYLAKIITITDKVDMTTLSSNSIIFTTSLSTDSKSTC